jgi:hypothetical protein
LRLADQSTPLVCGTTSFRNRLHASRQTEEIGADSPLGTFTADLRRGELLVKSVLLRLLRQSPAMVVATIALLVALSGTALATTATLISGQQIKNNSIAGIDVRNGSLSGADVRNRSLTAADFRGSLRGARGAPGAPGPPGAQGPRGDKGDEGVEGEQGERGPTFGDANWVDSVSVDDCDSNTTSLTYPVDLAEPARIYATVVATYSRSSAGPMPSIAVELVSNTTVVASTIAQYVDSPDSTDAQVVSSGVMTESGTAGFTIPAGSYTLRAVFANWGNCAGTGTVTYGDPALSHIELGGS